MIQNLIYIKNDKNMYGYIEFVKFELQQIWYPLKKINLKKKNAMLYNEKQERCFIDSCIIKYYLRIIELGAMHIKRQERLADE